MLFVCFAFSFSAKMMGMRGKYAVVIIIKRPKPICLASPSTYILIEYMSIAVNFLDIIQLRTCKWFSECILPLA